MQSARLWVGTVILIVLLSASAGSAKADTREIELNDGSVIAGEIISLSDGIYTVRSASLGTLRIEASRIRVIRAPGATTSQNNNSQVDSLRNEMLSDAEIMNAIRTLQNDPDVQKILQDPEIMKAIRIGDIGALMRNPKFMKLLDKQSIRDINNKLAQ
jgi:hypothetical protein